MKIIGIWNGSVNGEFTTTIDLYYNLKQYINVEFHLCVNKKEDISKCIRHLINNNNRDLLPYITLKKEFKSYLIISTSLILYSNIKLNPTNLFILDTLDLRINNYEFKKINCNNVIFFSNPANITDKIQYKQIEYYHKFSNYRLNNLPLYYKPNIYTSGNKESFLLETLNYSRIRKPLIKIQPGEFFENVGKRIFEHLLFNKTVNYNAEGFSKPDGLFYYLNLFNIDGFKTSYNLNISEQIIKEKLFMGEEDILLNSIKEL